MPDSSGQRRRVVDQVLDDVIEAKKQEEKLTFHIHPALQGAFFIGGNVTLILATIGFVSGKEYQSWLACIFWCFSGVCNVVAGISRPREIMEKRGIITIVICNSVQFLSIILAGLVLRLNRKNFLIEYFGWVLIFSGSFFALALPPAIHKFIYNFQQLPDENLHDAIVGVMRAVPTTLSTILYISAAAVRSVVDEVDDMSNVINPVGPTGLVQLYATFTFIVSSLIFPLVADEDSVQLLTWSNLLTLDIPSKLRPIGALYVCLTITVVCLFAQIDENGSPLTAFLIVTAASYVFLLACLSLLLFFHVIFGDWRFDNKRAAEKRTGRSKGPALQISSAHLL